MKNHHPAKHFLLSFLLQRKVRFYRRPQGYEQHLKTYKNSTQVSVFSSST